MLRAALLIIGIVLPAQFGCRGPASRAVAGPPAASVEVNTASPPPYALALGPVMGLDGTTCKAHGLYGTLDAAMDDLRANAARLGANYVQVMAVRDPHLATSCQNERLWVRGVAYKVGVGP